jgi:hypothetical protein
MIRSIALVAWLQCASLVHAQPSGDQLQLPRMLLLQPALMLPPVPALKLTPPPLLASQPASEPPHAPWFSYWRNTTLAREWRVAPDSELRLRLETGALELEDWSLSTGVRTTPERERECYPTCWGPDWESSVVLKYEVGALGPLQRTGPLFEIQGKPHASGVRGRGLLNIGLGGAF